MAVYAAATAEEVAATSKTDVGKRERKTTSMWGKAAKGAMGAAAGSAASIAAAAVLGKKSRADPVKSAASSAAGSIATQLAGPYVGRFVRNLIGGLMR